MRRLILAAAPDSDGRFRLEGKDFHYIVRVLRIGEGDSFRALLPDGSETRARVYRIGRDRLEAVAWDDAARSDDSRSADERRKAAVRKLPSIVLLQALPKGQKMDLIVRQATEAGTALILPFVGDRSVSRPQQGRDAAGKRERWERIVREARQQSGSDVPTELRDPLGLSEALDAWREFAAAKKDAVGVFLHQDPLAQGSLHGYLSGGPHAVAIAVGPEGGFSPEEASAMTAAGFRPALLGENVLRTETAALFAIAAVQVIILEKETWIPNRQPFPESNA